MVNIISSHNGMRTSIKKRFIGGVSSFQSRISRSGEALSLLVGISCLRLAAFVVCILYRSSGLRLVEREYFQVSRDLPYNLSSF